ncbi:hypothetical protein [Brevibacterium sp.]|nr:hypothetical protein [Brevibacterium sp.]
MTLILSDRLSRFAIGPGAARGVPLRRLAEAIPLVFGSPADLRT